MPQRFSCSEQKRPGLLEKRVRRGELVTPRDGKRGLCSTREQLVVGRYDRLQTKTKIVVSAKEHKQLKCIELPVLGTGLRHNLGGCTQQSDGREEFGAVHDICLLISRRRRL